MTIELYKKELSQILIDLDHIRNIIKYIDFENKLSLQKRITEDFNTIKKITDKLNKE